MKIALLEAAEFIRQRSLRRFEFAGQEVEQAVREIVQKVRMDGDRALRRLTERFDRFLLPPGDWSIGREAMAAAFERLDPMDQEALRTMAERIREFHRRQVPETDGFTMTDAAGNILGQRICPLNKVGLYVPGGRAAYPSSVLMGLIPAALAGVRSLYVATPPGEKGVPDSVLAAAHLAGAERVFSIGGAQAIAALAYGTETVPQVDMIVGPGNVYVTEAKRQVFGQVAIDGLAGPTEIVIVADDSANLDWVAADMLAQAEHDPQATAILICWSHRLAENVRQALARRMAGEPRQEIMMRALEDHGAIVLCRDLDEALQLANRLAPEHLSLQVAQPEQWIERIETAGALFLGSYAPVAAGDYSAGTNHILPTAGTGRFSSGVSVETFLRRFNVFQGTVHGASAWLPAAERVARLEGFFGHASSLAARREGAGDDR